jgi:hypothetical protein
MTTTLSLPEIETQIFTVLRQRPYYTRLKQVEVSPSGMFGCGWMATIVGDFSVDEHAEVNAIIRVMQQNFSLKVGTGALLT